MPEGPRVFVSYVTENRATVERLVSDLREIGADVWFDRDTLAPGVLWGDEIRRAISNRDYFLACFSREGSQRQRSYMNEELELAIAEIRSRGSAPWFIPILLSGEMPDILIGPTRSLRDIQFVELNEGGWATAIETLARAIGIARKTAAVQGQMVRLQDAQQYVDYNSFLRRVDHDYLEVLVELGLRDKDLREHALIELTERTAQRLLEVRDRDWPQSFKDSMIDELLAIRQRLADKVLRDFGRP